MNSSSKGLIDQRLILNPRMRLLVMGAGLFVGLVVVTLRQFGVLQPLELYVYDRLLAPMAAEASSKVAIAAITDEHLDAWGWPLPDEKLAAIANDILSANPRALGIDIYRDRPIPPGSEALDSVFGDPRVVAISKLASDGGHAINPPAAVASSDRYGFADVPVDPDGVVRRGLLLVNDSAGVKISFAYKLALAALGKIEIEASPTDPQVIQIGQIGMPRLTEGFAGYARLDDRGYQFLVDFTSVVPHSAFFAASDVGDRVVQELLRDKVVLVGITSEAVKDFFKTPLNRNPRASTTYGVQVHAAIVDQLLRYASGSAQPIRESPTWLDLVLIFGAALFGAFVTMNAKSTSQILLSGPVATLAAGGLVAAPHASGYWLPVVPVSLAWLLSFGIVVSGLALVARRQRRILAALFSAHLPPALANDVWRNQNLFLAGSRPKPLRLFATVMFADLAGSTTFGGSAHPDAYMAWISAFLDRMSEVARKYNGLIEKYTGDGLMVVFGAPLPRDNEADQARDAVTACHCALAMLRAVRDLNDSAGTVQPYRIRIGIHTGTVLGGTVGMSGSMQYTVIGDAANLAARVESFGKSAGMNATDPGIICVSEATRNLAGSEADVRPIGTLRHDDGRSELAVYRLFEKAMR